MTLTVNGEAKEVPNGLTLRELVRNLSLEQRPIAVELNRRVVPKDRYDETRLSDGDAVEIVTLVGGG